MTPYFEGPGVMLYAGECSAVMAEAIPDASIDLTVTSPPYDNLREYNGYTFDFEAIAAQLWRVTKPGGVVVWVVGDATINGSETGTSFRQALGFMELGFNLHDTMIYRTNKPPLTHNRYEQEFEFMFILSKGTPRVFNALKVKTNWGGTGTQGTFRQDASGRLERAHNKKLISDTKLRGNIWHFASGHGKGSLDDVFSHPGTFPEALARDHILSWSNPGDVVLDPMCGSGTTLKMALQYGRKCIGIDISAEYIELTRERIAKVLAQPPLFRLTPLQADAARHEQAEMFDLDAAQLKHGS